MALAAHAVAIKSATTSGGTYTEIDGINDVSFGPSRDMLETTDFKDTSAAHTRMAGLKDGSASLSGDYESADTGWSNIASQFDAGSSVFIKFLWNGSAGHLVECMVESYEIKASVDGKVEVSCSLKFVGAPSTV